MSQCIPNAAHKYGTVQIFERNERIVNAQQHGRQFEVDEKNDNAEINQRMRYRNQIGLLVDDKDDRS